ncbi:GNAT family N-acetyltransferase [Mariniluteicoccus endophyticus]
MTLEHQTITVQSADPAQNPEALAWLRAVRQGFLADAPTQRLTQLALEQAHADGWRMRAVRDSEAPAYALDEPVATFVTFDKTLNVGPLVPVTCISDVTVRATHRRRGLLRAMMTDELHQAKDRGHVLAALTVTEGSIYGRFGFGPTTHVHQVEVDTSHGFGMRHEPGGRAYAVDQPTATRLGTELFARLHARRFGSIDRLARYAELCSGEIDPRTSEPDTRRRNAVHVGTDGQVDGWVAYGPDGENRETLVIHEFLALDADAYLALWQLVASIDLARRVRWGAAPVDDVLPWVLTDPRGYRVTGRKDLLWTRVLDAQRLLAERGYAEVTGRLVLAVTDPLGHAEGIWELAVERGAATVRLSDEHPDIRCTAEELGPLVLGGVTARQLVAAGRIEASADAQTTADTLFESLGVPWTSTFF